MISSVGLWSIAHASVSLIFCVCDVEALAMRFCQPLLRPRDIVAHPACDA